MTDKQTGEYLIDPPVFPWSPLDELRAWEKELQGLDDTPNVRDALRDVREWIKEKESATR